ncbi:MAG: LOG family protein [Holosporales bacterium]|nr:LOG family protein [Holosporales bacterium]
MIKKPNSIELSSGGDAFLNDLAISRVISARTEGLVAILGGSRIPADSVYYESAFRLATSLSKNGISITTGGGPGIMEAGNKGAQCVNNGETSSYGLKVRYIKDDANENLFLDQHGDFTFNTLSVRMLTLIGNSDAIVFFPGGFGTFEELFSLLVRLEINMIQRIPVYLFGMKFWHGLLSWLSESVLKEGTIIDEHLKLFKIEDDVDTIAHAIVDHLGMQRSSKCK